MPLGNALAPLIHRLDNNNCPVPFRAEPFPSEFGKPRAHHGTDRDDACEYNRGIKDRTHIPHGRHLLAASFGEPVLTPLSAPSIRRSVGGTVSLDKKNG